MNTSIIGVLLLASTVLSTVLAALCIRFIHSRNPVNVTLEQTSKMKAIHKQAQDFPMLQEDTALYLQSIKVFSKKEANR